jgi:hypothetical protein
MRWPSTWHRLPGLAFALAVGATLAAGRDDVRVVRSRSEQFVVHSPTVTVPLSATDTNRTWIEVQPDPLAVSAERIKQRVLTELEAPDRWQGRIHLNIRPELPAGSPPLLTSARFADGWQYSVRLPTRLDREVLVRGLLQAVLTEIANRTPGVRSAELPAWLVYGLAAYLVSGGGPDVAFEANSLVNRLGEGWAEVRPTVRLNAADRDLSQVRDHLAQFVSPQILLRWGDDGIRELRQYLGTQPPLTFTELSLPGEAQLAGEDAPRFRASALLLTLQLLSLPDGPRMARSFLGNVSRTLNWQTAFFAAYSPVFSTPADVEKWWAVSSAGFSIRDESKTWSTAETLDRLDVVLLTPIRVTPAGQAVPETVPLSLQRVLSDLDTQRQLQVLRDKLPQLRFLQGRASRDTLGLVTGYADVVARYLELRPKAGAASANKNEPAVNLRLLLRSTLARLEVLDTQRAQARETAKEPPASIPTTP